MSVSVRQLHTYFAGEVRGLDLRAVREQAELEQIRSLMDEYAVLVVRDQPFEDDEQAGFAERFDGTLHTNTGRGAIEVESRIKNRGVSDISNLDAKNELLARNDRRRMYALGNRLWHTDASFNDPPGRYSMLSAKQLVPPEDGETEYVDTRAGYDALPPRMKAQIGDLRAHHTIMHGRALIGFTDFSDEERAKFPGADWPVVRLNPCTQRKSLYIGAHADHIVDWPVPEGRLLLHELVSLATLPQFVYRHVWQPRDFVIWDNRCTMHRGLAFDEMRYTRDLRRVTTLDLEISTRSHRPIAG